MRPDCCPIVFALLALLCSQSTRAAHVGRQNITVIVGSDLAFFDLGFNGEDIRTPDLNELAKHGLRFTAFYNMARCCPTQAALLTGFYPLEAGVGHVMEDPRLDGRPRSIDRNEVPITETPHSEGRPAVAAAKPGLIAGQQR